LAQVPREGRVDGFDIRRGNRRREDPKLTEGTWMSALRWPAYTTAEISECLMLALASSPLACVREANFKCRTEGELAPGVTCPGDERDKHR
jgi:hypothetical protein